jgi:type I pantothenate kinase
VQRVRGLGDRIDLHEVEEVYLPMARLLNLYIAASTSCTPPPRPSSARRRSAPRSSSASPARWRSASRRPPGSCASCSPAGRTPEVELVTTDGSCSRTPSSSAAGCCGRKGFPESYDRAALLRFVAAIKSGSRGAAPVYSHLSYDIVPGVEIVIRTPTCVIVEGLNVLQPARVRPTAGTACGERLLRLLDLRRRAHRATSGSGTSAVPAAARDRVRPPESYFHRYASLSDGEAVRTAEQIWHDINERNLVENVLPTRGRATLVLTKGADHAVRRIRLRKL